MYMHEVVFCKIVKDVLHTHRAKINNSSSTEILSGCLWTRKFMEQFQPTICIFKILPQIILPTKGSWREAYALLADELWVKNPAINNISRGYSILPSWCTSHDRLSRRGWGSLLEKRRILIVWLVRTQTRVDSRWMRRRQTDCDQLLVFSATVFLVSI